MNSALASVFIKNLRNKQNRVEIGKKENIMHFEGFRSEREKRKSMNALNAPSVVAIIIIILAALIILAVRPYNARRERMKAFAEQYIAHRGLHDNRSDAPENSMKAYEKAVEAGYGIELDVRMTSDCQIVCFHDPTLMRATHALGSVEDKSLRELLELKLFDSEEHIPIFWEVLQNIGGKVPLIVEVKAERGADINQLCKEVVFCLDSYEGTTCIESFHPGVLNWFRKNHPSYLRGQLATRFRDKGFGSIFLTICFFNFITRPDFIAYDLRYMYSIPYYLLRKLWGAAGVAWTCKSDEDLELARSMYDVFIFDSFVPSRKSAEAMEVRKAAAKGVAMEGVVRKHVYVSGRVQGVGFRYHATYIAQRNGVSGWVKNLYDGRVEMEVQGTPERIDALFEGLKQQRYIMITGLEMEDVPVDPRSFEMKVRY